MTPHASATVVIDYHERTKHRLERFAAGPDTLDWDAQPDPFRRFAGAPLVPLPLVADGLTTPWSAVCDGSAQAHPVSLASLGAFFELSFGLTAWKSFGPDRWALRANPSSGNLHPTEAYLLAAGVDGLPDGLYHYAPKEHALERRAALPPGTPPQLWLGLASIQWREAWKYGERAFRYCQLDTGHALGAARYAAATLGWPAEVEPMPHPALAALLGLDRDADFGGNAEREEPELLVRLSGPAWPATPDPASWQGQANRLDRHPMYRWPVIDAVAQATRETAAVVVGAASAANGGRARIAAEAAPTEQGPPLLAATLIRRRRSAQHFDRRGTMPLAAFLRIAEGLLPDAHVPWDAWPHAPRVHALFYAHRVDGLTPGVYLLARDPAAVAPLQAALRHASAWQRGPGALLRMAEHPALAGTLRMLSCHQAIASDACFAVSLLAAFDPAHYRAGFQEAGLIGQALYLGAEAEGYRGTGIGCYFDDAVHELLGLQGTAWQVLYHFTVGVPLADTRLSTEPPYPDR